MRSRRWLVAAVAATAVVGVAAVPVVTTLSGPATPTETLAPPRFVEVASTAGLQHSYDGEWPFFVGGGIAAFDCDEDGRPELFIAGGSEPAALYRNDSSVAGELRFTRSPHTETDLRGVTGAYPLDVDGDGHTDLAVLRDGENVLLRGMGDCRFERANEQWGFDGGDALTTAFSATWEDGSSLPTLAFGNYVAVDDAGGRGDCHDNELVRPDGSGERYADPVPLSPGWCSLSVLFSDWNRSGRSDLRISNDRHYNRDGEEQLWRLEDGGTPELYTRDEGWQRLRIWGMGIASHDVTGDGFPEVFLASQGDNKLQALADGPDRPEYRDIAIRRGATAHRPFVGDDVDLPSTGWHAEFQDVNNDGFADLFVAKGNVEAQPDHAAQDPNNLLLGQPDGSFVEAADEAGVASFSSARGAALVDLDLDGMLDLITVNRRSNVELWRNVGWGEAEQPTQMGGWIAVSLEHPGANRDGVGSWIEVRVGDHLIRREVTVGGGHAGGQLGWYHFGLGPADRAEVRVLWPGGDAGPWMEVDTGSFAIVEHGTSDVRLWDRSVAARR